GGDEDEWGDEDWEDESPYQWRQKISYGYAGLLHDEVNLQSFVFNELRSNSEVTYEEDGLKVNLELELFADQLINETELGVYQLNFIYSGIKNTDLKIGRQVITWGTGDLLFLNDLFSKGWSSFFNGRNDKYLKPPVDAIRLSVYRDKFNWEIAHLPKFEPDQTLTGERYSFYLPGIGIDQPQPPITTLTPERPETAVRVFGSRGGIEWAAYAYTGFFKSPSKMGAEGLTYAEMDSIGASVRMPAFGGLLNLEYSHYESNEDSDGSDPLIQNSQFRFLLGFETEIAANTSLASQAYLEKTLDYGALLINALEEQVIPEEHRTMFTVRLTNLSIQQKLVTSLMLFYSPSDEDHFLRGSLSYKYDDNWLFVGGLNFLEGKREQTFLGQMKENSNWYFRVEYSF
ncbi:MAG: hypothetical protein OQK04_16925, partial [Kangiellaceae bacterium]|nr:hypothetical protein [Kangiellaceae bacterium]